MIASLYRMVMLLLVLLLSLYSAPSSALISVALQPKARWSAVHTKSFLYRRFGDGGLSKRKVNMQSLSMTDISVIPILEGGIAIGGSYLLLQLGVYWRMQYVTASIIGGIPRGSSVVELDAQDGKNVFYLPNDAVYTAVMSRGLDSDDKQKSEEKMRFNEQLILESIGKANRQQLNLQGRVRARTQDIASKSMDCVLSTGALSRAAAASSGSSDSAKVEAITEAYRILRPGGVFVFVEPDNDGNLSDLLLKVFPATIKNSVLNKLRNGTTKSNSPDDSATATFGDKKNVNRKKSSARSKRGSRLDAELAEQFSTAIAVDEKPEQQQHQQQQSVTESTAAVAIDTSTERSSSGSNGDGEMGDATAATDRPGVAVERLSNIMFPHITGIAIRP